MSAMMFYYQRRKDGYSPRHACISTLMNYCLTKEDLYTRLHKISKRWNKGEF